jgi:hypothetical protein
MNARTAVKTFGELLIGQTIRTQPCGDWPGGLAKVRELYPDKQAKEIVMQIEGIRGQGEIGVFKYEQIEIV